MFTEKYARVVANNLPSRSAAAAVDVTAPELTSWPRDGQNPHAPMVFTFSEPVTLGDGTITLWSNNGQVYSGPLSDNPHVVLSGETLVFDPPRNLSYAAPHWLELSANAITDLAGNPANGGAPYYFGFTAGVNPVAVNLTGTEGDDILLGGDLADTIYGNAGMDEILGYGGDDLLDGGDDADRIDGGDGNDLLHGGANDDWLAGGEGNDVLYGDGGDDRLEGGMGDDRLEGGDGTDSLSDAEGENYLSGGNGDDFLFSDGSSPETPAGTTLDGGAGNDQIGAGSTVTSVLGGAGNDTVRINLRAFAPGAAAMKVDMGDGDDRIEFQADYGEIRTVQVRGGAGSDHYTFVYGSEWPAIHITDFQTGSGGDTLDIFSLLPYSSVQDSVSNPFGVTGHARLVQDGGNVLLQFDADGVAGPLDWVTRVIFHDTAVPGFTGANFTDGARPDGASDGLLLEGTNGPDTLQGGRLDDTIRGRGGDDYLVGNGGADTLHGDEGDDDLYGSGGDDFLDGGAGSDWLDGGEGDDELRGGSGNDALEDRAGNNVLRGGAGDDRLSTLSEGRNALFGEEGNDTISSSAGDNLLDGGAGDDRFLLQAFAYGAHRVNATGGDGNDYFRISSLQGAAIDAVLAGGAGIDTFFPARNFSSHSVSIIDFSAGAGGDVIDLSMLARSTTGNPFSAGGSVRLVQRGVDTVIQSNVNSSDGITFQDALVLRNLVKDTLTVHNFSYGFNPDGSSKGYSLTGGSGPDQISGGWLDDTILGGPGNDVLSGSMGNDHLVGGSGDDRLDGDKVDARPEGLSYEWPTERSGDDVLEGGAGNDILTSSWGADILSGGAGDDLLVLQSRGSYLLPLRSYQVKLEGGAGNDVLRVDFAIPSVVEAILSGGTGRDTFELYAWSRPNPTVITDFQTGAAGDILWLHQAPSPGARFEFEQRGADTVVRYDPDGAGAASFVDLVILLDVAKEKLAPANLRFDEESSNGLASLVAEQADYYPHMG